MEGRNWPLEWSHIMLSYLCKFFPQKCLYHENFFYYMYDLHNFEVYSNSLLKMASFRLHRYGMKRGLRSPLSNQAHLIYSPPVIQGSKPLPLLSASQYLCAEGLKPPFPRQPLYMAIPPFYILSKPPTFGKTFLTILAH